MQPSISLKAIGIQVIICLVAACSQEEEIAPVGVEGDRDVATSGDIVINVSMDSALENSISLVSATGTKPGAKNPVETQITIRNESAQERTLQVKGDWYDTRGNRYGGSSATLTIAAGQTYTFHSATRSPEVTGHKLFLTQDIQSKDELYAAALADPANRVAEGYGMTYSETALDEVIPALPLRGFANGEAFVAETVAFYQGRGSAWRLEISDHPYDVLKGPAFGRIERKDMQTITIDFDRQPAAGDVLSQEMIYGGGIFQIKKSDGTLDTTSWNTSLAYAIYIDRWVKEANGEQPCGKRRVGRTSGKLFISFQGSEFTFEDSWLSGEFKEIPIVYCSLESV